MNINYSFKLGAPATPVKLVEYSYNEFLLDLPAHWHQVPTAENNTLNWHSDTDKAATTVSIDFYEVPAEQADAVAEHCLCARHEAVEKLAPGQVTVLKQDIRPYSGGNALEIMYVAAIPGTVYCYLGYVSARKIFNFTLTCGQDKFAAADLFNTVMRERLRVMLP